MNSNTYSIDQLFSLRHHNKLDIPCIHEMVSSLSLLSYNAYNIVTNSNKENYNRIPWNSENNFIPRKPYISLHNPGYNYKPTGYHEAVGEVGLPKVFPIFDLSQLPPGAKIISIMPGASVPPGAVKVPASALKFAALANESKSLGIRRFAPVDFSPPYTVPSPSYTNPSLPGRLVSIPKGSFEPFETGVSSAILEDGTSDVCKSPEDSLARSSLLHQDDDAQSTIGSSCDSYSIQIQLPSPGI